MSGNFTLGKLRTFVPSAQTSQTVNTDILTPSDPPAASNTKITQSNKLSLTTIHGSAVKQQPLLEIESAVTSLTDGTSTVPTLIIKSVGSNDVRKRTAFANETVGLVRMQPSFRLRGVEPLSVLEKYLNGDYNNVVPTTSTSGKAKSILFMRQYGISAEEATYLHKEGATSHKIITTGNDLYKQARSGKGYCNYDNDCDWCRKKLGDSVCAIGIPLKRRDETKTDESNTIVYDAMGHYCSYNCAYADLLQMISIPRSRRPIYLINAEALLLSLYNQQYPDSGILQPTPHWSLLRTLTTDEYYSQHCVYIPMSNVHWFPCKKQYINMTA